MRLKLLLNLVVYSRQAKHHRSDRNRLHRTPLSPRPKAFSSRRFHDQRNTDGRVVNEKAVLLLAVLAERLAVIAEKNDETVIIKLIALQPREQATEFAVGIGDLPVVGMTAVLRGKRLRRIVG